MIKKTVQSIFHIFICNKECHGVGFGKLRLFVIILCAIYLDLAGN